MNKKVYFHSVFGLLALVFILSSGTGCGLMIHGTKQTVDFTILPYEASQDAKIYVEDREITGKEIELLRKESHKFRVECPGYETYKGEILKKPDATALILDIIGTGAIGVLIDVAAGAAHKLEPGSVRVNLQPLGSGTEVAKEETYTPERTTTEPKIEPHEEPKEKVVAQPFYPSDGERWALVVGISTYEDSGIPPIPNAAEDARAVRDYLVNPNGGGYAADHVFLLTDYDATSRKLQKYIGNELRKKVQREDDLFIYFACHGMVVPTPQAGSEDGLEKYLVPYDTVAEDVVVDGISMDNLNSQLDMIECTQVAMVLDTCFSGGARSISTGPATRNTTISSSFLKKMAKQKGKKHRKVLTASSASELAQDDPDTGHGIFTTYFLEGLEKAEDKDGNGSVTLYEVFRYLDRKVRVRSAEIGRRQNPQWAGDPAFPFSLREVE